MKAYKEKQFLVFEFEDGKNVKYNLATHECIGKLGRPVKDVCTQLRGYNLLDVINSFQDIKYRNFLEFVDGCVNRSTDKRYGYGYGRVEKVKNIGTFLKRINEYSKYEQLFSSGLTKVDYPIHSEFKDIPKGLIKICREQNIKLENRMIKAFMTRPNMFRLLEIEFNTLNRRDILDILTYDQDKRREDSHKICFFRLVDNHNYKPQALLTYLDNLMTYEAIEGFKRLIVEVHDYVNMMSSISDKYEKYPKNFLTTHRIASRNYIRLRTKFEEDAFKRRIDKTMECTYNKYVLMYPENTNEIKDEAVQQNNCVASYIQKVIDGKCHILFLRRKDSKEKSLVTVEVKDGKVVQALGKFNRSLTDEEQEVIDKYNNRLERMKKVC